MIGYGPDQMTVIAAREFTILNKAYRAGRMCLWKK